VYSGAVARLTTSSSSPGDTRSRSANISKTGTDGTQWPHSTAYGHASPPDLAAEPRG